MSKQWITAIDWETVAEDVKSGRITLCDSYGDRVINIECIAGNTNGYRVTNHPEDVAQNMGRQEYIVEEGSRYDHFYIPFGRGVETTANEENEE